MSARPTLSIRAILAVAAFAGATALAADDRVQLDPFAQATRGHPACPARPPPLMTREEVERSAHARVSSPVK